MSTPINFFSQGQSRARKILVLALLLALTGSTLPGKGHAQGAWTPVNGTVTAINNGPGDQIHPHISEALVAYTSIVSGQSEIRYFNMLAGTDTVIPGMGEDVYLDFLPDLDGTQVVYTHLTRDAYAINIFDTNAGGVPIALDPQPSSLREKPSIGAQTVAWVDFGVSEQPYTPEIVVYDRTTGLVARLTDDLFYDTDPNVSPDGSLIVWTKCQTYGSNCRIWQASRNGSGWGVLPLQGSGEQAYPTTDGQYIVYTGYSNDAPEDTSIFWQQRGGSEPREILLLGDQRNPAVDSGVVVFESWNSSAPIPNWNILVYDIEAGAGYRVAEEIEDDNLPDIAVAPDGLVRVVWMRDGVATGGDVYASTFRLPETGDEPPVIDSITGPLAPVTVGTTVSISAAFRDPDAADTHTALWDWGDGSTAPGAVSGSGGAGTAGGSHVYTAAGVYPVTLTVSDSSGNAASAVFQYVVVYDPTGGFVTGGGWITSPAGAYAPDPVLEGKAHFGFVSRYQKGADLPSGRTEFQFKAGDLHFRSTSYDWLVIAGAKAQFKGAGTVNGSGDYAFLLAAIDGNNSEDKFRIKIWDRASGEVMYDNQMGADETAEPLTSIGGGAIAIQK